MHLQQFNQLQHPRYAEYITQLVVDVELKHCNSHCEANNNETQQDHSPHSSSTKWFKVEQMSVNQGNIWGPDPYLYVSHLLGQSSGGTSCSFSKCRELSVERELRAQMKRWEYGQKLGYTASMVHSLYDDFVQHCYPALNMNQVVLEDFLSKIGVRIEVVTGGGVTIEDKMPSSESSSISPKSRLYGAFCIDLPYVRFRDLIMTLVAIDKNCKHGDISGELRARCIFRYYTKLGAGEMTFSELVSMHRDIGKLKKDKNAAQAPVPSCAGNNGPGSADPVATSEAIFSKLGLSTSTSSLPMDVFMKLIGDLTIRGTASMFRSTVRPCEQLLRRKVLYERLWGRRVNIEWLLEQRTLPPLLNAYCNRCEPKKVYTLAVHSMTFNVTTHEAVSFHVSTFKM